MFTVFECEECGGVWSCEGTPERRCPQCGAAGVMIEDDNGGYCYYCGYPEKICECMYPERS